MNAVALLEKYFPTPDALKIVMEHSRLVAAKALQIARALEGVELDLRFIEEAALLHDIGVCRTNAPELACFGSAPYICHGILGRDILEAEGFPVHAMVCERHIGVGVTSVDIVSQRLPIPTRDMTPRSIEERLVCFADLFYSKKPRLLNHEKSVAEVRNSLGQYGSHKVVIFDDWLREFRCPPL